MRPSLPCPDMDSYQNLVAGRLPVAEAEALVGDPAADLFQQFDAVCS